MCDCIALQFGPRLNSAAFSVSAIVMDCSLERAEQKKQPKSRRRTVAESLDLVKKELVKAATSFTLYSI